MNTAHNPDGTVRPAGMRTELSQTPQGALLVTVTSRGHHRLSELRDTAALAFATARETAVDWPVLIGQRQIGGDAFVATFALPSEV